jgi:FG-GAP-like repeat
VRPSASAAAAFCFGLAGAAVTGASGPPAPPAPGESAPEAACTGCHALPPPDVLPRSSWSRTILDMASLIVDGVGVPKGAPPPNSDFDVSQVIYYYESRAPRVLPSPPPWPPPGPDPGRFARHPLAPVTPVPAGPGVSHVRFLPLTVGGPLQIVTLDMLSGLVLAADPRTPGDGLRRLASVPHPCHVQAVDLDRDGRLDLLVADLGDVQPTDELHATLTWLRRLPDGTFKPIVLASGLPRVADVEAADFDGDGRLDLIVAAFGWRKAGGIFLFQNRTTDWAKPVFVKKVIDDRSGAIHVPVADLNGDGRPDFVALLAQHYEAVVAFLNDGQGGFRQEMIDKAPHPAWGSSGIQLVDLDGDGDIDVLVTNGDMLDDFQLKPYHSVRWLENEGSYPFVPHDLAHMFGVMRAQAADLDGDGDLDIVACAFVQFSVDGQPPRALPDVPSLVWLEQTSPGTFAPHTLELGGQHVSLDLADYDGDGDVDIVVGDLRSPGPAFVDLWENLKVKR